MSNDSPSLNSRKLTASFSSPEFNDSQLDNQQTTSTHQISSSISTSNSNSMIQSTSNAGIKLNTTRDSGFSDSLIEDSTSSSTNSTQFIQRSEHTISTQIDANKLNSVDEVADEQSKEFITIVKTTKVTTKVKHIKNPKSKNKKNKKKIQKIDENKQLNEIVTEIITENESTLSANINGSNNQLVNGNIQQSNISSKQITQTNGSQKEEDDERTSNSSGSNNIFDEEDEEDSQIAELNGLTSNKKTPVIKVNINKSTEELVYQAVPPPPQKVITDLKDSLATTVTTYSTTQHLSTTLSSDLNTSILDSEELLSDYSTSQPNPLDTSNQHKQDLLNTSLTSSIKEIPNVIDFALNDVTNEPVQTKVKIDKKKKKFNLFSKSTQQQQQETKRKLSKKDDLLTESPSKKANKEDIHNILSFSNESQAKYTLLDQEQKERILYLKQESTDLLMSYFVQFESNSNTKTQITNLKNEPKLNVIIRKMVARSLDLLRHDKIESFDKLAAQLKKEYKINDLNEDEIVDENYDFNNVNSATNDLVFKKLLQEALMDKKLLLNLNLDKSNCRPYEEIIDFSSNNNNKTVIRPQISTPVEQVSLDTVQIETFKQIEVEIKQEIVEEKPTIIQESVEIQPEVKLEIEQPQLEAPMEEGQRIVLDTIKEPPIVFPSELEPKPIVVKPVQETDVIATPIVQAQQPVQSQPEVKKAKKAKKNKKNAMSCMACGTSSMRKSDDDLNKIVDKQEIKHELVAVSPLKPVEDLTLVHQSIFSNLDPKPEDKIKESGNDLSAKQEVIESAPADAEILPQEIDVEVNVTNKEADLDVAEEIAPTPPSTPEDAPKQEQQTEIIQPLIELKQNDFKVNESKNKKNKKKKVKVTNEIQLNAPDQIDVSVLDVKVETFIESDNKTTNGEQTVQLDVEEPVKIAIRHLNMENMENEQSEVERKSFSELIEITQTIVGKIEDNQEIKVNGSNLDIKTEIEIGIEKEIFQEQLEEVAKPELIEPSQQIKAPLSDDIVKLPEPSDAVQQVIIPTVVADKPVEATKPTEKLKVKKEKKTKASCFSCRAKKVKTNKDNLKQPIAEQTVPAVDATKTVETTKAVITKSEEIDRSLFVGLDRRASQEPIEQPASLYTVDETKTIDLKSDDSIKESVQENLITQSLVGVTSIADSQLIETTNEVENPCELETKTIEQVDTKPIEIESENKVELDIIPTEQEVKTEVEVKVEQKETPVEVETKLDETKVISDDVVVLPDPTLRQEISTAPKTETKKEESNTSNTKVEKRKKKKTTSCFPKNKKEKAVLIIETKKVQVPQTDTAISTVSTAPAISLVENKIIDDSWSVGLDRRDEDVVVRRDPIEFIAPVIDEQATKQLIEEPVVEETVEKLNEIQEIKEPVEPTKQAESAIAKDTLADSSWIVIDRQPDHAYIPIITSETVVNTSATKTIETKPIETKSIETSVEDDKPKRKTSKFDLPLINILKPKKKKEKKAKNIPEVKQVPTTTIMDMPSIDILPKSDESLKEVEIVEPEPTKTEPEPEIKIEKTEDNISTDQKQAQPEVQLPKAVENEAEIETEKVEVTEVKQEEMQPEEPTKSVELEATIQVETTVEVVESKPESIETVELKPDEPIVHIKLDREPDIVKLPEINEPITQAKQINAEPSAIEVVQTVVAETKPIIKAKKETKRTTSIFDMPLINILVPNETKKAKKTEKKLKKKEKQTPKTEPKKQEIPELLIIDVPTLDIVKSEQVHIEQKIDAEIPVATEPPVDNFNIIKMEETKQPELIVTETVPLLNETEKNDLTDDGSWVIIDRQVDHATIPENHQQSTVEPIQPKQEIIKIETITEQKVTETKKTKSKKPTSCFSSKAKKQKELVKNEPIVKIETKQIESLETKPTQIVQKTEFDHDFSGLDRRDSEVVQAKDQVVEQPIKLEQQISQEKEVFKNENIEEIIKEELKEVDKQYPELIKVECSENAQIFTEISEQIVTIINVTEQQTEEAIKTELEQTTEAEEDEATKRLDDVLEVELKKLDESFDVKPIELEVTKPELIEPTQQVKAPLSDDIVKLPEPSDAVQQVIIPTVVADKPVEATKPTEKLKVKKEKKTKASCFSCKARKAKEVKEQLADKAPTATTETLKQEVKVEQQVSPLKSESTYDADLFKGLDRGDDTEPIKEPVNLDQIKQEPIVEVKTKPDDIFNEVIQEIIQETIKPEVAELDQSKSEPIVDQSTDLKEKNENLNVSIEIPPQYQLLEPQASSSPKKLSDDIVVLPDPDQRSPIQIVVNNKVATTEQLPQTDDLKPKKSNPLVSFLCGNKTKTSNKKSKTKTPLVIEPPVVIITQETVPFEQQIPVISVQPPKKPPRGNLDTTVNDNDIDSFIPRNEKIIEKPLIEEPEPTSEISHVLIDPQVQQPLKIEIQNENSQSPVVIAIQEQQILTTNMTTSLLSTTKIHSEIKTEKSDIKIIEYPSVIDVEHPRVTTWNTDPLPSVRIGLHKINDSNPQLVEQQIKPIETVKVVEQVKAETNLIVDNETIKKFTNEERKLLKTKQTESLVYLKQKAGYVISSTSSKHEKEKEKIANKLFKKGLKIVLKNDSKPMTYATLNKKLSKEVSAKKYSNEITNCSSQLKEQIEQGLLLNHLQIGSQKTQQTNDIEPKSIISTNLDTNLNEQTKLKSSSADKLDKVDQPTVMKRFPSLTWREANERARILFYKGRVPSIHYNEKRDSFRVSMITSVLTNGTEKTTEVPVCDDDVRRLLNSCGLYWNGESLSLLNKSDDIFSIAQQEAFDILQLINSNN